MRIARRIVALALGTAGTLLAGAAPAGVLDRVPERPDSRASYLIYLHGRIIEEEGVRPTSPRYGIYEYRKILEELAQRGFTVVSEQRPKDTDPVAYSAKVVGQVNALVAAGVPERQIAVVGFSKGALIALLAAAKLHHPGVRVVSLAGCGDWIIGRYQLDFSGPVYSFYDAADDLASSCRKVFAASKTPFEHHETELHVGQGHGTFFRPNPAWLDPVTAWLAARR